MRTPTKFQSCMLCLIGFILIWHGINTAEYRDRAEASRKSQIEILEAIKQSNENIIKAIENIWAM